MQMAIFPAILGLIIHPAVFETDVVQVLNKYNICPPPLTSPASASITARWVPIRAVCGSELSCFADQRGNFSCR